jgi:hypothetical protein
MSTLFLHAMLKPFPVLKSLQLMVLGNAMKSDTIPDSFLGGSSPHLQDLDLDGTPFPALPKLLLSINDLVTLTLHELPPSVYISPEVIVTCLFAWTRLEILELGFQSPISHPDQESQISPSTTCTALPALTCLDFKGRSEYLEKVVARIDATPLLNSLTIQFFDQPIFHTPCLSQFIGRVPRFQALTKASVVIFGPNIFVTAPLPTQSGTHRRVRAIDPQVVTIKVLHWQRDWHPSTLTQICTESLSLFFTVEHFYMICPLPDIKNSECLELLHPFSAVKNLYLSKPFTPHIIAALNESELGRARLTNVLPALQNIFIVDFQLPRPVLQAIEQFLKARQHSGNRIGASYWKGGDAVNGTYWY